MKLLLDGDLVCYRCAAVNEKSDFSLARWQADQLISRIIEDTNADDWSLYITGGNNNFRYQVYPDYKANRRDQPKPRHLEALREHLILDWQAFAVDGAEADDAMGVASQEGTDCIIASIDKDLLQLPGRHFNFVNRTIVDVSYEEGWKNFFRQLLIGDPTDNIKGCPGLGKVKTEKLFKGVDSIDALLNVCVQAYKEVYGVEEGAKQLDLNATLLYIWRIENDQWHRLLNRPTENEKQEGEVTLLSSLKTNLCSTESTTVGTPDGFLTDGTSTAIVGP